MAENLSSAKDAELTETFKKHLQALTGMFIVNIRRTPSLPLQSLGIATSIGQDIF